MCSLSLNKSSFIHSFITNLLVVLNYIESALDTGGQIDTVYLDMSKAFDLVNHKSLLQKLQSIGIGGNLLHWFRSYLTNHVQRLTVHGLHLLIYQ